MVNVMIDLDEKLNNEIRKDMKKTILKILSKQDKCYCCSGKATTEHKQAMKIYFCNNHNIIDFYKRRIAEFEFKKIGKK